MLLLLQFFDYFPTLSKIDLDSWPFHWFLSIISNCWSASTIYREMFHCFQLAQFTIWISTSLINNVTIGSCWLEGERFNAGIAVINALIIDWCLISNQLALVNQAEDCDNVHLYLLVSKLVQVNSMTAVERAVAAEWFTDWTDGSLINW